MALPDLNGAVGHSFGLEIDGVVIKHIQEVSGLKMEQDTIEMKANSPDGKYINKKLPGRPKAGEVTLTRFEGPSGGPVVINNLKYWGADHNKGFNLYKSTHHYKGHGYDYSFKDANGFTVEIDTGSHAQG